MKIVAIYSTLVEKYKCNTVASMTCSENVTLRLHVRKHVVCRRN